MPPRPLISIILPTYNREAYLRQAVQSVFAQTYDSWELLVVDDGSSDGTRAYLETVAAPLRPVFLDHSGNRARVRNIGVRAAYGSYVAFLDSDDVWLPEKLASQMEDLRAHPECRWSYTGYSYMDDQGREIPRRRRWTAHRGRILEPLLAQLTLVAMPTVMMELTLFEEAGGFDESLRTSEDLDLWIRLAEAHPAAVVATPLAKVRRHSEDRRMASLEMLVDINRIFDGLLTRTTSSTARTLGRRQRVRINLRLIARSRYAGRYADARKALRMSFPYAGWHPGWWAALLKTWLRPAIPQTLLSRYNNRARTRR